MRTRRRRDRHNEPGIDPKPGRGTRQPPQADPRPRKGVYKPTSRGDGQQFPPGRTHGTGTENSHGDAANRDTTTAHMGNRTAGATIRLAPLLLLLTLGARTRAGRYGFPIHEDPSDEEDAGRLPHGQPLLPPEDAEDGYGVPPWWDPEPSSPDILASPGSPEHPADGPSEPNSNPDRGAHDAQDMDVDGRPPSPADSTTSTSTTDELNAALDLPEGSPERAAMFERIALKLGVRRIAQGADARRPAAPPASPNPGEDANGPRDATTQTFIALPAHMHRDQDAAMVAALHERHVAGPEGPRDYEADGSYTDHSPLLHTRDYEVTAHPITGPRRSPPWPAFMRRANAEAQTPRVWSASLPPLRQDYLYPHRVNGIYHTASQRIWLAVPETDPRVPLPGAYDDDDDGEIRAEVQDRATGIWASFPPIPPRRDEDAPDHRRHRRSQRFHDQSHGGYRTLADRPVPAPGARRVEAPDRGRLSPGTRTSRKG